MRVVALLFAGTGLVAAVPVQAADALKFGPPPSWVAPQPIPTQSKPTKAPVSVLLNDQQIAFEPGKTTVYTDDAMKIENPQGLSAGNLSLVWNPATDSVTVNKLHIIRDGKVIDVLASQKFTVLRRETNLDAATLDGTLTANIQPEGLQEGDIIELATTIERSDPVLKGHVEATFGEWNGLPIQSAHASVSWPAAMKLSIKETGSLPQSKKTVRGDRNVIELTAKDVQPTVPPKGAPPRFQVGRLAEATDFASWSDLSNLMRPLFDKAAMIPASGPLHDEVEKIRASSDDPKVRAEQALALVEQRVRYVALEMGQGGYVPASAEDTWSRRFGDCKAKSALLLAILHSLGIEADPVLVQSRLGDVIADRLPMAEDFDHAIVRARIAGKTYWLDGTRTGDTSLDAIHVPDFGWVLPLTANASLVHLVPPPLDRPETEVAVNIDASDGVYAPAPTTADFVLRGDSAVGLDTGLSGLSDAQAQAFMQSYWNKMFDFLTYKSGSFSFDKSKRELHLTMSGEAKLDWSDGHFHFPDSSVGYDGDFDRAPGPFHDAPWANPYPAFARTTVTLRVPPSLLGGRKLGSADIHDTIAGVQYDRVAKLSGDTVTVETSSRSVAPEVPYNNVVAAKARLSTLADEDVQLPMTNSYKATQADARALAGQQPQSASDYFTRANAYVASNKTDEALADLTAGLKLDPKNVAALGKRAFIYFEKHQTAEAKKDIATALSIDPDNSAILTIQGTVASTDGEADLARESYNRALQVDPTNFLARLQLGWLYNSKNDVDGAIREFSTLIAQDPKNATALAARAFVYASKEDFQSAEKDIAAAEAIDPRNPVLGGAKAQVARKQHGHAGEVEVYTSLIKANPKDGSSYFNRASAYSAMGKDDLALKDSDQAIALGFKDAPVRLLRANLFMHKGDHAAVAREAELMIKENPTSTFAFVAAAKSYAAIGQRDKAMQAFTRAIAIKPEAYIYLNRSSVRPHSDYAGRMADLSEAQKLEPNNVEVLWTEADLFSEEGNYSKAVETYDAAIKAETDPVSLFNLRKDRAVALYKAGRTADAAAAFGQLEPQAETASGYNALCWSKATAGLLLESALQDCRQALKLEPDSGPYLDSLGMVLLKLGKLREALDAYDKAIAKNTGADSLMGRAFVYSRLGDKQRAEADAAAARKKSTRIDEIFADYGLNFDDAAIAATAAN